jgi:uncharacterized tellurite resistance protein B-like protein
MREQEASCLLVAKILAADGMMATAERAFLLQTMESFGLDDAAQQRVFDFVGLDEAEAVLRARPVSERREILDRLVEAAFADGRLSPHETATIRAVTEALGVD